MVMLIVGVAFVVIAVFAGIAAFVLPRKAWPGSEPDMATGSIRQRALDATDRTLRRRGLNGRIADELDLAGSMRSPAAVTLTVLAVALGLFGVGAVVALSRGGVVIWLLPFALAAFTIIGNQALIRHRIAKRRAQFAEQLDDSLQLISSGLRAGHSLIRAVDAVSQEAESPTAEEFSRIVNEHRLGRDLGEALQHCAERMQSDDLAWAAQAVAVHREVGGNLSEVLDHVGDTIRERNQIRRQVASLSAEGKMSANVLIALPVGIAAILAVVSPSYVSVFVTTPLGVGLIVVSLVLFALGVIWLRRLVKITF